MKIDYKKVMLFMKGLDAGQFIFLCHLTDMAQAIQKQIRVYNLSKEFICQRYEIKLKDYNSFIKGNWNYDTMDMAVLNTIFMEFEIEALKDKVPVQVVKS